MRTTNGWRRRRVPRRITMTRVTYLVLTNGLVLWSGDGEGGQGLDFLLQAAAQVASLPDQFIELGSALAARSLVRGVESARMEVGYPGDVATKLGDAVLHGSDLLAHILSLAYACERGWYIKGMGSRLQEAREKCVLDCRNLPSHLHFHCHPLETEGHHSRSHLRGSSSHGPAVEPGAVAESHERQRARQPRTCIRERQVQRTLYAASLSPCIVRNGMGYHRKKEKLRAKRGAGRKDRASRMQRVCRHYFHRRAPHVHRPFRRSDWLAARDVARWGEKTPSHCAMYYLIEESSTA